MTGAEKFCIGKSNYRVLCMLSVFKILKHKKLNTVRDAETTSECTQVRCDQSSKELRIHYMKAAYKKLYEHMPTHIKNFFISGLCAAIETKIAWNPERT